MVKKVIKKAGHKEIEVSKQLIFSLVKSELFNRYQKIVTCDFKRKVEVLEVIEKLAYGNYDDIIMNAIPDELEFNNYLSSVYIIEEYILKFQSLENESNLQSRIREHIQNIGWMKALGL